eukprot:COSAG06_NODE_1921_length_8062_cov_113.020846_6_plen_405_part_00
MLATADTQQLLAAVLVAGLLGGYAVLAWALARLAARLAALETTRKPPPPSPPPPSVSPVPPATTPASSVSFELPGSGVPPRALATKLAQESVSVCDFGAVPNSMDDQSAPLQKALDWAVAIGSKWNNTFQAPSGGVRLFFPAGVYRLSRGLTVAPGPAPPSSGHVQLSLEGATGMASTLLYDPSVSAGTSSTAAGHGSQQRQPPPPILAALSLRNVNRFAVRSIHLQSRAKVKGSVGLLISGLGHGTGTGPVSLQSLAFGPVLHELTFAHEPADTMLPSPLQGIIENCQVDGFDTGVQVGEDSGPGGSGHLPSDVDHAASELIFTHLSLQNCLDCGFHRCSPDTLNLFLFSICATGCPIAVRLSGDSHRNSANLKVLGGSMSQCTTGFQLEVAGTFFIQGVCTY